MKVPSRGGISPKEGLVVNARLFWGLILRQAQDDRILKMGLSQRSLSGLDPMWSLPGGFAPG
jgi:hypothetical protein